MQLKGFEVEWLPLLISREAQEYSKPELNAEE